MEQIDLLSSVMTRLNGHHVLLSINPCIAMTTFWICFPPDMPLTDFFEQFGEEAQCEEAIKAIKWPDRFICPACGHGDYGLIRDSRRTRFQCKHCRHQTTLTVGTLVEGTKLPLRTWFLATYLVQVLNGQASPALLRRLLAISHPTASLIRRRLHECKAEQITLHTVGQQEQHPAVMLSA